MLEIHADLTIGADGRNSTVREKAGLEVIDLGAGTEDLRVRASVLDFGKEIPKRSDLNGAQFDKSYTGPWAWFRLMDASNIQSTPQSNIYLITFAQI